MSTQPAFRDTIAAVGGSGVIGRAGTALLLAKLVVLDKDPRAVEPNNIAEIHFKSRSFRPGLQAGCTGSIVLD